MDKYGDIPVRVYSNARSVELFLNGKFQGLKTFQEKWTADGRRDTAKVTWDELDPQVYAQVGECVLTGQVAGCELPATVTIHMTDVSVDGEVISNQWTGSNLPLVFASHSEPNHPVSYLNDKVISRKKLTANTWIAKSEQANVGILFGDAGILKPRFVDNVTLYYVENQEYLEVEPTFIDYYIGNEPSLPRTPNHLDKDSLLKQEENWRPVSAIRKVSSDKDEELRFEFDKVETYALRLRFEGLPIQLEIDLGSPKIFNVLELREDLKLGQESLLFMCK